MKKIFNISVLSLAMVGALTSCDMDAPNQSALEPEVVGYTEKLAESAIMAIHQSFGETNSYRGRFTPYYGLNTDIEILNSPTLAKTPDGAKNDLAAYNATPNNSQMNTETNAYAKFYEGIERANMVIDAIDKNGDPENRKEMASLKAEAMTLRAVLYLDLIKGWGDVPYRFEPITKETMYVERCDRDTIYKRLLDDLEYAENHLSWPNGDSRTKSVERVSQAFARGLRARTALYAGGYSYRADGTVRKSNDPDLSSENMYRLAAEECQLVIDNCKPLSQLSFEENFRRLCQDDVSAGEESLWEIPFSDGRGRVLYTFGVKHNAKDQYTGQPQGGVNGPMPTLFYDYDVDDVRRNITCVPYRWSNDEIAVQDLESVSKWCFGKLRYEWMNRRVTSNNDDGVNFQYMRLADVYLMAAESYNALHKISKAWSCMEPVLSRVLPSDKVNLLRQKYTASEDAFFDGIVEQRAFEFAGEMLRKADLVRWNLIDQKMAEAKQKLRDLANREGDYADLPDNLYYIIYHTKAGKRVDAETGQIVNDIKKTIIPEGAEVFDTPVADETLIVYGLNHGNTDDIGQALKISYDKELTDVTDDDTGTEWTKETWLKASSDGTLKIKDDFINGLYINTPSTHAIWPIWQTFVDKSNGKLNNSWLGY